MPITPFHFGPGAALHATAPKYVSFLSFCAANVLTDIEPLYYLATHQFPVHRFLHTYLGASLTWIVTTIMFAMLKRLGNVISLPNVFGWRRLSLQAVVIGAILGAYSHIVLDSIMHTDIHPLAPFSDANALLHLISISGLHWLCIVMAAAGAAILSNRALATMKRQQ